MVNQKLKDSAQQFIDTAIGDHPMLQERSMKRKRMETTINRVFLEIDEEHTEIARIMMTEIREITMEATNRNQNVLGIMVNCIPFTD